MIADMPVGISYMGTKRQLAGFVSSLAEDCQAGPFLDLFSGMCAVGSEISRHRQVWTNDLQLFSREVAFAHFCSKEAPLNSVVAANLCLPFFKKNQRVAQECYNRCIKRESGALGREDVDALVETFSNGLSAGQAVTAGPTQLGWNDLFVSRFGGTYFGYNQAIEIDSLRYAVDQLLYRGLILEDSHRWLLIALCVALSKCASTTGHFAQPLSPKKRNIAKFIAQRRRSIWLEWVGAVGCLAPLGSRSWRKKNKSFQNEALELLESFSRRKAKVIYADPPYTKDHYSRFYHIYETALLYDYPVASGRGLYRSDRKSSIFSLQTTARGALEKMVMLCAEQGADLILSYPENGVLKNSECLIRSTLKEAYGAPPEVWKLPHKHSTLGGSKGEVESSVTEVIYRARLQ